MMISKRTIVVVASFLASLEKGGAFSPLQMQGRASNTRTSATRSVSDANYHDVLGSGTVLVDAYAPWCGPCKLVEPILKKVVVESDKWSEQVDMLVKFNVEDKNPNLKMELLFQSVLPRKLPCLVLFQDGKAIGKTSGLVTEQELDEFLSLHLSDSPKTKTAAIPSQSSGRISFGQRDTQDDYMLSMS